MSNSRTLKTAGIGIALLAAMTSEASVPDSIPQMSSKKAESAAKALRFLIDEHALHVDAKTGAIAIDQTLFNELRDRGLLDENVALDNPVDTRGGGGFCGGK